MDGSISRVQHNECAPAESGVPLVTTAALRLCRDSERPMSAGLYPDQVERVTSEREIGSRPCNATLITGT